MPGKRRLERVRSGGEPDIGNDFHAGPHDDFDPQYMRSLYDYGYQQARYGYNWAKVPPMLRLTPAGTTPARAGSPSG
jgi:hypothetical protein